MDETQTTFSGNMVDNIRQALEQVQGRIAAAALRAGRTPSDITLVAVSKTFPAAAVLAALGAGQRDFGENRVEEALPKMAEIGAQGAEIHWHLIGHLQSRKVKEAVGQAVGRFALIHSVDTLKLATTINNRIAALPVQSPISPSTLGHQPSTLGRQPQPILLECNISGEAAKSGFNISDWEHEPAVFEAFTREVEQIIALPHVSVRGLMTMAPIVQTPEQARPFFASLRLLRGRLRERFPAVAWEHLSMGMTDDFEAAVAEGATLVRIGRAIFGERTYE
ncbi:MAG: YggS family pyridoxal phosphate-dependent enzyme [Chloroflexi bacterium]|nr:YggS family pyridoxal phosphate-dependent enzyme [Chloroflexota bacterium]